MASKKKANRESVHTIIAIKHTIFSISCFMKSVPFLIKIDKKPKKTRFSGL